MDRHQLALECVQIERSGGDVREYPREHGCISPWGTWHRLQKEELGRGDHQITDGKGDCSMKQVKVTEEEKAEAARIAIEGGDPRLYLLELGSQAPDVMWWKIRKELKEKEPEKFAQLPNKLPHGTTRKRTKSTKKAKKTKKKPEAPKEIPEEVIDYAVVVAQGEKAAKTEKATRTENQEKKAIALKATAAEGLAGRWEIDDDGEINLTAEVDEEFRWLGGMTPLQWEAAAAELPEVLKMFGLEAGRR